MGLVWSKQGVYASSYMSFKVEIKNIGKLADAELRIGRFTVFAGPNNTGKSFVSKLLYSLFDAINANHAETHIVSLAKDALSDMDWELMLNFAVTKALELSLDNLKDEVNRLEALVKEASIEELEQIIPNLVSQMKKMQDMVADILKPFLEEMEKQKQPDFGDEQQSGQESAEKEKQRDLENLIRSLVKLQETFGQGNAKNFIAAGIRDKIQENLIQNFQVPKISDLRGEENASSKVNVEDFGHFEFSNGETAFTINASWIKLLQEYSRVIYLESPVYWKLKNALGDINPSSGFFSIEEGESASPGFLDISMIWREH